MSGALCLVLYSVLLYDEYMSERFVVSPFLAYLFLSWIRLGLVPIYVAIVVAAGGHTSLGFAGHEVSAHFVPGQFINVLGDFFFVCGYYVSQRSFLPIRALQFRGSRMGPRVLIKCAVFLVVTVWAMRLLIAMGVPLGSVGQPHTFFECYGVPAAVLTLLFAIEKTPVGRRSPLILLTAVVFLIDLRIALASYMKQAAIICLLPFFLYLVANSRTHTEDQRPRIRGKRLILVGLLLVCLMSILFTYSSLRRSAFWLPHGIRRKEAPEISSYLRLALNSLLPGTQGFALVHQFPDKGVWAILHRNTLLNAVAWCYSYVQTNGTNSYQFFKKIPAQLVPRLLWPDKPMVAYGRDMAVLLGQARSWKTATTSTGLTMAGGFYLGGKYPLLVLGMFVNGILFSLAWKVFSPAIAVNPFRTMMCISLFVNGVRGFEGVFDGNVVDYIFTFGCFLPLSFLWPYRQKCLRSAEDEQDRTNEAIT